MRPAARKTERVAPERFVLAAIDDSAEAARVARVAASLAASRGAEVILFTTIPIPIEPGILRGLRHTDDREEAKREARATLGRALPAVQSAAVAYRISHTRYMAAATARGRARRVAWEIATAARSHATGLIVLGHRRSVDRAGASVAARVLRRVRVDVVVVPTGSSLSEVPPPVRPQVTARTGRVRR